MSTDITIVDYGMGNLRSVHQAFLKVGGRPKITRDPEEVASSQMLVLPGVGAYPRAMENLRSSGLGEAVVSCALSGVPILGICLGMQLLFDESNEFGQTVGLGLIPGLVGPITSNHPSSINLMRNTHIGWRRMTLEPWAQNHPIIRDVSLDESFYFLHSYAAVPARADDVLGWVDYFGFRTVSMASQANVTGVQFHPEKSGPAGLRLLANFLSS